MTGLLISGKWTDIIPNKSKIVDANLWIGYLLSWRNPHCLNFDSIRLIRANGGPFTYYIFVV